MVDLNLTWYEQGKTEYQTQGHSVWKFQNPELTEAPKKLADQHQCKVKQKPRRANVLTMRDNKII